MKSIGRAWVGMAAAILTAATLAGCSTGTASTGSAATGAGAGSTAGVTAGGGSTPVAPPATTPASGGGGGAAGGPASACSLFDVTAAGALLGGTPKQLSVPGVPESNIEKIDGCSYTTSSGTIGYAVNRWGNGSPTAFVEGAKTQMAQLPAAKQFDVGLGDASLGFTMTAGAKTLARIELVKGSTTIAVSASWADEAKAKSIALEVATKLVAAA